MARELGLNPKKPGSLDTHRQETYQVPLPQFIEELPAKWLKASLTRGDPGTSWSIRMKSDAMSTDPCVRKQPAQAQPTEAQQHKSIKRTKG